MFQRVLPCLSAFVMSLGIAAAKTKWVGDLLGALPVSARLEISHSPVTRANFDRDDVRRAHGTFSLGGAGLRSWAGELDREIGAHL